MVLCTIFMGISQPIYYKLPTILFFQRLVGSFFILPNVYLLNFQFLFLLIYLFLIFLFRRVF